MRFGHKPWGLILFLAALLLPLALPAAGLAESGQISGTVWTDKTADGILGGSETGYSGAKVTLEKMNADGQAQAILTAVTDKAGDFLFTMLSGGSYRLWVEAGSDYHFTLHGLDSAVLPAQGNVGCTPWFTLEGNEAVRKNAGVTKSYCTVSLIAFEDTNANGGRMQTEPLVRGVQAELVYEYEGETYSVASAVTDRQGEALFRDLSPATYQVRVALPGSYVAGPVGQKLNNYYNCIYPNEDNTGSSAPFSLAAKESIGMGVGMVRTGALEGKIWYDANYNGVWDSGENGLTSAQITLKSLTLGLSRTAAANEAGAYSFQGLQPGDYQLIFSLPEGMVFTYPGASLLSEIAQEASVAVSVQVDVTTSLSPVGAMPAAGMTLTLTGEDGALPGAAVAVAQGGKTVAAAETDETGAAVFHALRGGETTLRLALPEGWLFSREAANLFPLDGAQSEAQMTVVLDGAAPDAAYSVPVVPAASISGMLYEDADNTGLYRPGSRPLAGYAVQAVDENGNRAAQTVTDENGAYTLYPLLDGAYTVRFLLDEAYVASPYAAGQGDHANTIIAQTPDYGETDALVLAPGQAYENADGSVFRAGVVDGYVYLDEAYAAPESGMAGVTVTLLGANGQPVSNYSYGVTDESGYFFIKGVLPGNYTLSYAMPESGRFTDPATMEKRWYSASFATESGSEIHMPALRGLYTSSLAGVIRHEETPDGQPFAALLSLRGHTVNQVLEMRTGEDGAFAFRNLLPDTYTLTVALPEGMIFARTADGLIPPTAAAEASVELNFALGESRLDAGILAALPVSLSGTLYYDADLSATQEEEEYGAEERALSLWAGDEMVQSAVTDENGAFLFSSLIPGEYELRLSLDEQEQMVQWAGNSADDEWTMPVRLDADAALALPLMRFGSVSGRIWSLDGTTHGVGEIPVTLLSEQGAAVAEALTDEEGAFFFGLLMPGNYTLSATLPQGYLFARALDTEDRDSFIQSLPDGSLEALPFSVAMGDDLSGIDLGIGANGRIGDRAWLDVNGNGMQDMDEPNMPGIEITLFQHGEEIASAVTDEYGRYHLDNLYPGEYEMQVTMHPELKATLRQTDFPLVASILPESDETTVSVSGVIVPSGGENLHCDLGFQLRKKDVYPAAMDAIPTKDWRPYSER